MATSFTFPGVFIEEIPSGVRTITGVPTSIAAFVGRTATGPVENPVIVNNFGDFGRIFGGLSVTSSVSYAVRDFFQNGGGQAVIVRLFEPTSTSDTGRATVTITATGSGGGTLVLHASSPGAWGSELRVVVTIPSGTDASQIATAIGAPAGSIFNLSITFRDQTEVIRNLSLVASPTSLRNVGLVLQAGKSESRFVEFATQTAALVDASTIVTALDANNVPIPVPGTGGDEGAAFTAGTYIPSRRATTPADPKVGINSLDKTDIFNILCIPPELRSTSDPVSWGETAKVVFQDAVPYCVSRRAMLLVDPPLSMTTAASVVANLVNDVGISGDVARNAALYFPRVIESDPLNGNRNGTFVSCGLVAGIMARTDGQRGVWKAPAGIDAGIGGIQGLAVNLTDQENGQINPIGVNALRTFPIIGSIVWGARTLRGADALSDDYKYVPVRRFALFLEESLVRGLKFAVFEPNDEPLWAQIRLSVGAFLNNLFRQGAFQGQTPRDAYFVKCDKETTTQNDINLGVVNVLVGFAPLKPAEFVVIKIQQLAGQITT